MQRYCYTNIIQKNLSCVKAHTRKEFSNSHFKSSCRHKTYSHNVLYICNITLPHISWMRQILLWNCSRHIFSERILVSMFANYNSLSKWFILLFAFEQPCSGLYLFQDRLFAKNPEFRQVALR